jgi:hypothetical protein
MKYFCEFQNYECEDYRNFAIVSKILQTLETYLRVCIDRFQLKMTYQEQSPSYEDVSCSGIQKNSPCYETSSFINIRKRFRHWILY